MKKLILSLAMSLLLFPLGASIGAQGKNDTETNAQIEVIINKYNKFGDKYQLFETCGRTAVGEPWFARLYRFHVKDNGFDHWEREGYSTLAGAVAAVEADYIAHPEGMPKDYVGHYGK